MSLANSQPPPPSPAMLLSQIELRHLRYFAVLAGELNFSRAAARLNVSPSALSQNIRKLEDILARQLFERNTAQVRLTTAGRRFQDDIRDILAHTQEALEAVRENPQQAENLCVSIPTLFSRGLISGALGDYRRLHPGVDVALVDLGAAAESFKALKNGIVDVSFSVELAPRAMRDIGQLLLFELPMQALLAESHPLAAKKSVTPAELAAHPLLIARAYEHLRKPVVAWFRRHKLETRVRLVDSAYAAHAALHSEPCAGLMPAVACLRSLGLVLRPLKTAAPPRLRLSALWRQDDNARPVLDFIETLRQAAGRR